MPKGVGKAVVSRKCPKVYIPNSGCDPEMKGHSIADCAAQIIALVRRDVEAATSAAAQAHAQTDAAVGGTAATTATAADPRDSFEGGSSINSSGSGGGKSAVNDGTTKDVVSVSDILNYVLVDSRTIEYASELDVAAIEALGVAVLDCTLSDGGGDKTKLDPGKVVDVLLSLAC